MNIFYRVSNKHECIITIMSSLSSKYKNHSRTSNFFPERTERVTEKVVGVFVYQPQITGPI